MSVDYSKLEYLSLYGSDFAVFSDDTRSITINGTVASGAIASGTIDFRFGAPQIGSPGDPDYEAAIPVPNPFVQFWVSGNTPNDPTKWYETDAVPRPLLIPSSGGNVTLRLFKFRIPSTSTNPTTYRLLFQIYNPYAGAITISYSFRYIVYCIANT